ncbi:MAG TPA: 2-aminoethylphosphonate--pyruvate transaminase [Candidatus Phocaeicola gallistercoris]|nr:2-aminoethylphosphonate--pyruvate transaminase [Candidatus Phocaeicola gallistercoris]
MKPYLLLTPGPLTTSDTVKQAMMGDWCTWDKDYNVGIVEVIREELVTLASTRPEEYTAVLMQGSGTFCVEATLGTVIRPTDSLLVVANGAYGKRMGVIADYYHLNYFLMEFEETQMVDPDKIDRYLSEHPNVSHVSVVHCETTTGVLNPLKEIASVVKKHHKILIVDAMSSFGGIPIDLFDLGIDFMISSANKCIQGVPGFGFIIARRSLLEKCKGIARSLSLDLYDQWATMESGHGKWRFTSPTHVVRAFMQALEELKAEGGISARYKRYCENHRVLVDGMRALGFRTLLPDNEQSPIITSFYYPSESFDFNDFYQRLKAEEFVIYPGKISQADTFRIGNIGDVFPDDFHRLVNAIGKIGLK